MQSKLTLEVEDIEVLTDAEAARAGGGDGTMGCTGGGCVTTCSSVCDTTGCKPTSKGCQCQPYN